MDFDFDEETITKSIHPADEKFDTVIGELEEILMDEQFLEFQHSFFDKHSHIFTDDKENKLEYMDVFQKYTNYVEKYITQRLAASLKWFKMEDFLNQLKERSSEELQGDVFELLESLGDFGVFKEMMLAHKLEKNQQHIDLSGLLFVNSRK
ncbi:ADP-ribosylation factor-like protein 2-binding protein [Boothiomyces sp. JEL0866]|nr:ADP-ribosylation factor-like protein 2-binding protein [Boothiomyces sp. JEL0866]